MNTVTINFKNSRNQDQTETFDVYPADEVPASFKEFNRFYSDLCREFGVKNVVSFEDDDVEDDDANRVEKLAIKATGVRPEAGIVTVWKH